MTEHNYLHDALIILLAAITVVPLLHRLRVSPVIGYLLAGILVGPHGLALVQVTGGTRILAEFGVVFLLFTIGLDLPLQRLSAMRRYIFGLGIAQVAVTSAVIGAVAYALGASGEAALILGGALALSSTAAVLQALAERGEVAARFGRVAVAVLLFQDLAVVPLLALLPLLAGAGTGVAAALGLATLKAVVAIGAILLLGRLVVRPIYRTIAATRNAELFAATNLLVVLGIGWATAAGGMSMALGAFLAGLLLAETEYRHQVEGDIRGFRGLFLGLFFIAVGMTVDLRSALEQAPLVAGLAAALLLGKAGLVTLLCLAFRLPRATAVHVGLLLAQCGEFAFVILGLAVQHALLAPPLGQTLLIVVALTMATTPLLAALARRAAAALEARGVGEEQRLAAEAEDLRTHVIIAGFGRVGRTVAKLLAAEQIPYVALDLDVRRVARARAGGLPVYYGDASRLEVLQAAGAERARTVAVTLDQPEIAERAVAVLRRHYPALEIVARSRDGRHGKRLEQAGATAVVPEAVEASLQLGAAVLRLAGEPPDKIAPILEAFRAGGYALLEELQAAPDEPPDQEPANPSGPGRVSRRAARRGRA